ncbi:serine/threonine protein phosphatase [Mangrovactinospora gilvigrisea]|uniref:Serine/threonine protein phosphatase n=2 Tax=Mangrovactinospora gilvigrisea TaxID=1428644 RepID=A0A1J7BYE4_9ACTN|nr:serine/threonine protein phosphatase [Mangrovactinospora gilvigrisea]
MPVVVAEAIGERATVPPRPDAPPAPPAPPVPAPPAAPAPAAPVPPAPATPAPAIPAPAGGDASGPDGPPTVPLEPVAEDPTPTLVDRPVAEADDETPGRLFVVGDVHGHRAELVAALREQGLVNGPDGAERWSGGRSRVWFLGDFTDRGPDGIGVIELVSSLGPQAGAVGGQARALLGNHELLLLGAKRFGDTPVHSSAGTASFLAAWRLNGGQQSDLEQLTDEHMAWMMSLPALTVEDDYLLVHSDTTAYLEYGSTADEVHDSLRKVLHQGDAEAYWECFRRLTKRFAFRGESGPQAVHEMLDAFGGSRIVHGHSPIPYLTGAVDAEEGHASEYVTGPHVYAGGLVVAMDGGVTMDGPMLVRSLPVEPAE